MTGWTPRQLEEEIFGLIRAVGPMEYERVFELANRTDAPDSEKRQAITRLTELRMITTDRRFRLQMGAVDTWARIFREGKMWRLDLWTTTFWAREVDTYWSLRWGTVACLACEIHSFDTLRWMCSRHRIKQSGGAAIGAFQSQIEWSGEVE